MISLLVLVVIGTVVFGGLTYAEHRQSRRYEPKHRR
jgi:hypothetical protein